MSTSFVREAATGRAAAQVRDLIRDSIWCPGPAYGRCDPEITVLMPTYSRGGDGMFLRAARSVLSQTLENLDLIIIDDASTDGTADQIRELMRHDERISLITHPRNVGLPAISIFEAYRKARSTYLGFAFDDFVFQPKALEKLVETARNSGAAMVHGSARLMIDEPDNWALLGDQPGSYEYLRQHNFLPNAGVVLHRKVVDSVGWYDPHVAMARLCDWDLWERIRRRYAIEFAPVLVGTEYGRSRRDSLGALYPIHFEAIAEFSRGDRNHLLTAEAFLERDVWGCPADASTSLKTFVTASRKKMAGKSWARGLSANNEDVAITEESRAAEIVVVGALGSASSALYFDGLGETARKTITYYQPTGDIVADLRRLVGATAVVVVRDIFLHEYAVIMSACVKLQIPVYYMMDDNFFVLADEDPNYRCFRDEATRSLIRQCDGLIVTSDELRQFAADESLNAKILDLRPILNSQLELARPPVRTTTLKVAFAGGGFRSPHVCKLVIPALNELSKVRPLRFLVRGDGQAETKYANPNVEIVAGGHRVSLTEFIQRWQKIGPQILIHPRGETANADYKSSNAILIAYLLGAVPILADEVAYSGIGEQDGVIKVASDDVASWRDAIARLAEPEVCAEMRGRLTRFCQKFFAPEQNEAALQAILKRHPTRDTRARLNALEVLKSSLPAESLRSRATKAMKSVILSYAPKPVVNVLRRARRYVA